MHAKICASTVKHQSNDQFSVYWDLTKQWNSGLEQRTGRFPHASWLSRAAPHALLHLEQARSGEILCPLNLPFQSGVLPFLPHQVSGGWLSAIQPAVLSPCSVNVCVCGGRTGVPDSLWPIDCSLPGSATHGLLQARILEWVAIPFSWNCLQHGDWTRVSCAAGRFFTTWATRKVLTWGKKPFI